MTGDSAESAVGVYLNRQFGYWLAIGVPAFVVVSLVMQSLNAPAAFSVAAGALLSVALDPVADRLNEWRELEEEVNEHAVE